MLKSIASRLLSGLAHKPLTLGNQINNRALSNVALSKNLPFSKISNYQQLSVKQFSTSNTKNGLMEFFDKEKNWSETKIKHGREWRLDELRLKSNVDLHKLWFVLSKERNMLLTMEELYKTECEAFPSPERIAKVDASMENILHIVEERNIAHNLLETGESKAFIPYNRFNSFGYLQKYRPREYLVPWYLNKVWKAKYYHKRLPFWSTWYRTMLRAKQEESREKRERRIRVKIEKIKKENPEYNSEDYDEYLREYFEKKYNLRKVQGFEESIRKPRPDDIPETHKEKPKVKTYFPDDTLQ